MYRGTLVVALAAATITAIIVAVGVAIDVDFHLDIVIIALRQVDPFHARAFRRKSALVRVFMRGVCNEVIVAVVVATTNALFTDSRNDAF